MLCGGIWTSIWQIPGLRGFEYREIPGARYVPVSRGRWRNECSTCIFPAKNGVSGCGFEICY